MLLPVSHLLMVKGQPMGVGSSILPGVLPDPRGGSHQESKSHGSTEWAQAYSTPWGPAAFISWGPAGGAQSMETCGQVSFPLVLTGNPAHEAQGRWYKAWGGGLGQPCESLGSGQMWGPGCRDLGWSSMRIASIARGLCCEAGEEI